MFNILTQGAARVSPIEFFIGKAGNGYNPATDSNKFMAWGSNSVSLKELITGFNKPHSTGDPRTESKILLDNIQDNWFNMAWQSVALGAGFKLGKRVLRRPISQANRLLKMAGVSNIVKI